MKFLIVTFSIFLSSFCFADTGVHSIRLKQWDFEKGVPATTREDALDRNYSYVELCSLDMGCISSLWGHKRDVALILDKDSVFLKYASMKIHLMDLGAFISSGKDGEGRLFVIFTPMNPSVDVAITGQAGIKYLCDLDTGDFGQPTLGCQFHYQNKIQASIEVWKTNEVLNLTAKGARPSGLRTKFTPEQVNTYLYKVKSSTGLWENKK